MPQRGATEVPTSSGEGSFRLQTVEELADGAKQAGMRRVARCRNPPGGVVLAAVCDDRPGETAPGPIQYWARAYPGLRHLKGLRLGGTAFQRAGLPLAIPTRATISAMTLYVAAFLQ